MFVAMAGFTSCDDDFEQAPLEDYIPHATMVANTTAQELKEAFNQTSSNYYNVPIEPVLTAVIILSKAV